MNRSTALPAFASVVLFALSASGCTSKPVAEAPPEPAAPRAAIEKLSADGLFAFGKSSLADASAEGLASLQALTSMLASGRAIEVIHVIGHSDRIGGDKANLELSAKRAQAVREYLIERGVPAERITAVGRGSVEPVVECADAARQALIDCLAPNRRVVVRVHYAD